MRQRAVGLGTLTLLAALVATVAIAASAAAQCTVNIVPHVGLHAVAGQAAAFSADVNATNCTGTVTLDWTFGDLTPDSSQPALAHSYAAPGIYHWELVATVDGAPYATAAGVINVATTAPPFTYLMFIARNSGRNNTHWSSDMSAANLSSADATINFTFKTAAGDVPAQVALAQGKQLLWPNATASLFGVEGDVQGAVVASSNTPVTISVRSSTPFGGGTVGQEYQAVTAANGIFKGADGLLADLRCGAGFRTNIGVLNLSDSEADVQVVLYDGGGSMAGNALFLQVPAWQWMQITDVFAKAGAPCSTSSYALVQVHTAGVAWAYASVIDNATGSPATIAVRPAYR